MGLIFVSNNLPDTKNTPPVDNRKIQVDAIHFNFWILPKRLIDLAVDFILLRDYDRNKYFVDVGIRLKLLNHGMKFIDVHLPVDFDEEDWCDLHNEVLNEDINDLIFGVNVKSENGFISFSKYSLEYRDKVVEIKSIKRCVPAGGTNLYRIEFVSPISASESEEAAFYLRFRYRCYKGNSRNSVLISKGWGFAKRGFVVDMRVNDIRETIGKTFGLQRISMLPVHSFNGFVISSTSFLPTADSPPLHYSRLLELGAWDGYLAKCGKYQKGRKFSIHQWKYDPPDNQPITDKKPYRSYMHLHEEYGDRALIIYAVGVLTGAAINFLARMLFD